MCTRVLQFLVACTSTLALFAAGAWLGGKSASAAATSGAAGRRNGLGAGAAFAARGAERELALGDALSVNGQPMQLSIFFTGDPPEKVIAWYSDALAKKGFNLDRRKVQLHEPLKTVGEFAIPVKLHKDVTAHLKVVIEKEAAAE